MDEKGIKERLVAVETKLDSIYTMISNHLSHHFWFNITLLTIISGLVVALLVK